MEPIPQQIKFVQKRPWLMILIAVGLAIALGYMAWDKWGPQPAKPGSVVSDVPMPKEIIKMQTKVVYLPVQVIKDKEEAVRKLGLPENKDPKEALFTAAKIEANRHGAKAAVFINSSSGKPKVDIVYEKAPWFSLQRTNYIGGSIGVSSLDGYIGRGYLKRDFAQVKGVYLQGELEGIARPNAPEGRKLEGIVWANLEHRFDW